MQGTRLSAQGDSHRPTALQTTPRHLVLASLQQPISPNASRSYVCFDHEMRNASLETYCEVLSLLLYIAPQRYEILPTLLVNCKPLLANQYLLSVLRSLYCLYFIYIISRSIFVFNHSDDREYSAVLEETDRLVGAKLFFATMLCNATMHFWLQ